MSHWICCNACFTSSGPERQMAVTSCGHIICNVCFQRGKQNLCLICKAKCQISPLSDKSCSDVFSDISSVAVKYFSEISKVLQFQGKHQKRLLAHYQQTIERMKEEGLKMQQEMQKMSKKIAEQNAYISKLETTVQNQSSRLALQSSRDLPSASLRPASSVTKIPFCSPLSLSRSLSNASLAESTEMDSRGHSHKTDGLSRICLRSSPQNCRIGFIALLTSPKLHSFHNDITNPLIQSGCILCSAMNGLFHLGSVPHRASSQSTLGNHSVPFSATVSGLREPRISPSQNVPYRSESPWETPVFKLPSVFKFSSVSSLGPPS
ncbi:probable E3 SUMO-protein ligase RNF212 [Danio aesculapii]|uniref:probable E3 SUMO-protein ligase RNF212 n=1 Tax=Danio aesculapii TaxID=1142201 RepID=UPI0024BFAE99|nr:probable E3 SUMO-protein ligase RNF212 [Danio aesculapii]